jgi:hypothetical protein
MGSCFTQGQFILASLKLGIMGDMLFASFTSMLVIIWEARAIPGDEGQKAV